MNIATIQQVNDLGCCCPFPECPGNRWRVWNREEYPFNYFFVSFIKPTENEDSEPIQPTDRIPTLYDAATNSDFLGHSGNAVWYEGWQYNPSDPANNKAELRQSVYITYDPEDFEPVNGWVNTTSIFRESNEITAPSTTPVYWSDTDTITDPFEVHDIELVHQYTVLTDYAYLISEADHTVVAEAEHWDVQPDQWSHYWDKMRYYTDEPFTLSLQGWPGDFNVFSYSFDVSVTTMEQIKLTGPKNQTDFISDCITYLDGFSWSPYYGTDQPESLTHVYHRRYFDGGSYWDKQHWPWLEDGEDWPAGPSYGLDSQYERPVEFRVSGDVRGIKYKVGIPEDWEIANAAWYSWKTAHDAWEEADPETRGDEPEKPEAGKRSVFECQWQEVFFPEVWETWREAHEAYLSDHADWVEDHATWQTDHDAWEEADPETRGDEPVEPTEPVETIAKPTEEDEKPSLIQDREWTYGGPGTTAFSEDFLLPPPSQPGKSRPVNMMIICYHATAVGVKPTLHGEFVNLADP